MESRSFIGYHYLLLFLYTASQSNISPSYSLNIVDRRFSTKSNDIGIGYKIVKNSVGQIISFRQEASQKHYWTMWSASISLSTRSTSVSCRQNNNAAGSWSRFSCKANFLYLLRFLFAKLNGVAQFRMDAPSLISLLCLQQQVTTEKTIQKLISKKEERKWETKLHLELLLLLLEGKFRPLNREMNRKKENTTQIEFLGSLEQKELKR